MENKRIAIVSDSNSGITQREAEQLGITVLPMPFYINEQLFLEDITLTQEEFYKRLEEGANISTSQPSPAEVMETWERLLENYEEVIHIPMSSGLSNSCQTAMALAKEFKGRVQVADNQRISVTQRQSVLDAMELVRAGKNAAQIKEILEREGHESSIYITLETLKYLKKGGRITPAAAALGTVLNLKPVLQIQGDKLDSYAKARGMKSAFHTMLNALKNDISGRLAPLKEQDRLKLGIANTLMEEERFEAFRLELQQTFPELDLVYFPLTMSIGAHVGPGGLGIGAVSYH